MPIPFRDADDLIDLGTAGYLKIEPLSNKTGYQGALFLINARGEPIEFTYNRIETPHTFLWRQEDIHRNAARKLTTSLLTLCPKIPRLLLCLAEEVGSELFCQDIQVSVPVCRIAPAIKSTSFSGSEVKDNVQASEPLNLFWFPGKPQDDAIELKLLQELLSWSLIIEPFERASIGLREVYSGQVGNAG